MQVMVRHCKEDISEIPKPIWRVAMLVMSPLEVASYNAVAALAKTNLVVTGATAMSTMALLRSHGLVVR